MSFDYIVITRNAVNKSALKGFIDRYSNVSFDEIPTRDAPAYELTQGELLVCSIVGPLEIDEDDIPSELVQHLADKEPLFLYQINAPYVSIDKDPNFPRDLCSFIAQCGDGAAFDEQEGDVFFISQIKKRSQITTNRKERTVDLLELTFLYTPSQVSENTIHALLETFKRILPEALPVRFGDYEPFQGKVSNDNFEPFITFWNEQLNSPFGGSFNWTAHPPCFGGHLSVPNPRPLSPHIPSHYQKRTVLDIRIDATSVADTFDEWDGRIETLFLTLSNEFNSFYAAVCLKKSWIARGQNLYWAGKQTEPGYSVQGGGAEGTWPGLPHDPSWMTWFGPAYSKLLKDHLKESAYIKETGLDGTFIRMTDRPLPRADLKNIYPRMPKELMTPASIIPDLSAPL